MSNISQHIGRRGTVMVSGNKLNVLHELTIPTGKAIACGLTIFGALEAMYAIDKDVKVHEGQSSPFGA